MHLSIVLTNGFGIDLPNFSEVNYYTGSGKKTTKSEDLSDFVLYPNTTYNFVGNNEIILNGTEIRYLEITK